MNPTTQDLLFDDATHIEMVLGNAYLKNKIDGANYDCSHYTIKPNDEHANTTQGSNTVLQIS